MSIYLFTNERGTKLEVKEFDFIRYENSPGQQALQYAKKLQRKLKKEVFVWCGMPRFTN